MRIYLSRGIHVELNAHFNLCIHKCMCFNNFELFVEEHKLIIEKNISSVHFCKNTDEQYCCFGSRADYVCET